MVWKSTTKLGCGVSGWYVVCHYCDSTPNVIGRFEQNVLPMITMDSSTGVDDNEDKDTLMHDVDGGNLDEQEKEDSK